jgi:hypothetical protein
VNEKQLKARTTERISGVQLVSTLGFGIVLGRLLPKTGWTPALGIGLAIWTSGFFMGVDEARQAAYIEEKLNE